MKKLFSVLLVFVVFSSNGFALDSNMYHGSDCKAKNGKQSGDFKSKPVGIHNISNNYRWVSCPLLNDELSGTGSFSVIHWTPHPTKGGDIKCVFKSLTFGGATIQSTTFRTGAPDFTMPNLTDSDRNGIFWIGCKLPKKAKLNSIFFFEHFSEN